jgi:hypothetical protein
MTDHEAAPRRSFPWRLVAYGLGAAIVFLLIDRSAVEHSDRDSAKDTSASAAEDTAEASSGPAAPPGMAAAGGEPNRAEFSLPPILGPPRGPTANLCDEDQWPKLGTIMKEFGAGEVVVDEHDWKRRGAGTRVRMASWASKCKAEGAPIKIRGDASGEILAVYDAREGFRSRFSTSADSADASKASPNRPSP